MLHRESRSRSSLWWEHGSSRRRRRSETLPGGSIPWDVPWWGGHAPWYTCQNQVGVLSCRTFLCCPLQIPPHDFFLSFTPRFQRYRGLKSFRTSPWDPMENLPHNYSRIFQFQSFERTRRRILAEAAAEDEGALVKGDAIFIWNWTVTGYLNLCSFQSGWYVTLHIINVPFSVIESVQSGKPMVLVSLLPHEQKVLLHGHTNGSVPQTTLKLLFLPQMSVMHVLVQRHPSNTEPIKSKEELVFHCGFRRFRASPIFSQHTSGRTPVSPELNVQTSAKSTFYPYSFALPLVIGNCFFWFGRHSHSMTSSVVTGHPHKRVAASTQKMHFQKVLLKQKVISYIYM